jgi:hypothetical protein
MRLFFRKSQAEISPDNKLEYFRKLILDHLDSLGGDDVMSKGGKALPVGTVRDRKGGFRYIKIAPNKWVKKYDNHSRGAKMAIAAIRRKIAAAKDGHEMMQIILQHRDRFADKEGHPLPFVMELHNYIMSEQDNREKAQQGKTEGKRTKARKKADSKKNTKKKDKDKNDYSDGLVGPVQLKKIQEIVNERLDDGYYDDLLEKFDVSKYSGIGLRVIDDSYNEYNKKVGYKLNRSHDWESGTGNFRKKLLSGTSTIGIETNMDKVGKYGGDKVLVVCGDSYEHGNDVGEIVISGARILDIFDPKEIMENKKEQNEGGDEEGKSKQSANPVENLSPKNEDKNAKEKEGDSDYYRIFYDMLPGAEKYKDKPEIKAIAEKWVSLSKEIDALNKKRMRAETTGEKSGLTRQVKKLKDKQHDLIFAPFGTGGLRRIVEKYKTSDTGETAKNAKENKAGNETGEKSSDFSYKDGDDKKWEENDKSMRKEYEINGKKIVVENGSITIDGKLAHDGVLPYHIRDIKDAPGAVKKMVKEKSLDMTGKVYVDGGKYYITINREIAEEAARQTEQVKAAQDPRNIIEGYAELLAAYDDRARYAKEFDEMMDDEYNDGAISPKKQVGDPESIAKKYPRAAAYLKMEGWSKANPASSTGYIKRKAGEEAVKRLLAGDDVNEVIDEANAKLHNAISGNENNVIRKAIGLENAERIDPERSGVIEKAVDGALRFFAGLKQGRGSFERKKVSLNRAGETIEDYRWVAKRPDVQLALEKKAVIPHAELVQDPLGGEKTIAVDFDGVINSYKSGWQGPTKTDEPVLSAAEGISGLWNRGYKIIIFSTRASTPEGADTIREYIRKHTENELLANSIEITDRKPIADVYIDDRAIPFTGDWEETLKQIEEFKPWIDKSLTYSGYPLQGRTKVQGMDISIENKKGSTRSGVDKDGHEWSVDMNYDYGYIRGTVGVDKDHLDCVSPNTCILMGDYTERPASAINIGDILVGSNEIPDKDRLGQRKHLQTRVTNISYGNSEMIRILLEDGRKIETTPGHLHYVFKGASRDKIWRRADRLKVGQEMVSIYRPTECIDDDDYKKGYLFGAYKGDGSVCYEGDQIRCDISKGIYAICVLERVKAYWKDLGLETADIRINEPRQNSAEIEPGRIIKSTMKIAILSIRGRKKVDFARNVLENSVFTSVNWCRGYLAGFYDTDGSMNKNHEIQICQIKEQGNTFLSLKKAMNLIGFNSKVRGNCIYISSNWNADNAALQFTQIIRPAMLKKRDFSNQALRYERAKIVRIEKYAGEFAAIQTEIGTYIANGLFTHNCYVGPNPESEIVYIVNQNDPVTGKFDEQKVMLGFKNEEEAKEAYLKQYDRPGFLGDIVKMDIDTFKEEAFNQKNKGKPLKRRQN